MAKLQALIEKTYKANGNKRVVLLCHSLGCSLTNRFLSRTVTESWKEVTPALPCRGGGSTVQLMPCCDPRLWQVHIEAFVTSSGVFGGSHKAVVAALYGNAEGIPSTSGDGFFQPLEAFVEC